MTPNPITETPKPEIITLSTDGLTTKVVKGSLWTLLAQVAPMAVSLIATPFTIRLLGSEAYGVVILVGLIPTYFSFADFGMGIASTKFGAEAHGKGNPENEGAIVRTAVLIALVTSLTIAVPISLFSHSIVSQFGVPESLQGVANIALRVTSVSFVLGIFASVINTPMLARLRMDLNSIAITVPRILMTVATPIVLYYGGGILGAVWTGFVAGLFACALVLFFSVKLLPELIGFSINVTYLRPLLKFGGGWIIGTIAAILLVNLEKLLLSRMVSVKSLAFYSVAFTFAGMATMFSSAMLYSLIPAFSQLNAPEKKEEFNGLFARAVRLNLIWLLPMVMFLFVIAKPFFTLWAGPEFGVESTLPFYILLFGLFFNILAYIPHSTITARGRTDIFAKLYWVELLIYTAAVFFLINWYGIVGAAAAWSLRVILDAFAIIWFSKRVAGVPFKFFNLLPNLMLAVLVLLPAASFAGLYDNFSLWLILLVPSCMGLYSVLIWKSFVEPSERIWIKRRIANLFKI